MIHTATFFYDQSAVRVQLLWHILNYALNLWRSVADGALLKESLLEPPLSVFPRLSVLLTGVELLPC